MPSASLELRNRTREAHSRLAQLPYVQSLLNDSLALEDYGGLVRAAAVIHETVDRLLRASTARALSELSRSRTSRTEELLADLVALGEDRFRVDAPALLAELFGQRLRSLLRTEPMALVGVAYVLEGPAVAAPLELAHVRSRPELRKGEQAFVLVGGSLSALEFEEFERRLDSLVLAPAEVDAAVLGANETFVAFENILRGLCVSGMTRAGATLLNVDAGHHALPEDLREIAAALRAGEVTWEKYGYYDARFGERGKSFTRSDSAWLAALCACDPPLIVREVRWLGSVLAHRGMPRYLLEDHLGVLHGELCRAVPAATLRYGRLLAARDDLRAERQQRIDEPHFARLAQEFEAALPSNLAYRLRGSGVLPVAAAIDEACGLSKAVTSLASWWNEGGRLPEPLRFAFQRTLAAARRAASPSGPEIQLN